MQMLSNPPTSCGGSSCALLQSRKGKRTELVRFVGGTLRGFVPFRKKKSFQSDWKKVDHRTPNGAEIG